MLADGVEASVRSLASRDETAIRAMVARIIAERTDDGQFDECDLTFRDLDTIEEAFVAAAPRDVPPAGRLPAEQDRRARGAAGCGRWRRPGSGSGAGGDGRPSGDRPRPTDRRQVSRAHVVDGWRIDVTVRPGVPRLLSGAEAARVVAAALARSRGAEAGVALGRPADDAELAELNADAPWPRGPDRRPVVPAPPAGGLPAARGGPAAASQAATAAAGTIRAAAADAGRTSATSPSRWSAPSPRPRRVAVARPGTSGGPRRDELRLLLTHGALHVCGWDHAEPAEEAAMRALERRAPGRRARVARSIAPGRQLERLRATAAPALRGAMATASTSTELRTNPCAWRPRRGTMHREPSTTGTRPARAAVGGAGSGGYHRLQSCPRRSSSGWGTPASSTRRPVTTSAGWSWTAWRTVPGGPAVPGTRTPRRPWAAGSRASTSSS